MKKKVLVVGDIMLDKYYECSVLRISPEAPVPVANIQSEIISLGGAANVAHCLKRLGAEVTLMGALGVDNNASEIKKMASEIGIETIFLESNNYQTTLKTRIASGSQQLLRVDQEEILSDEDSNELLNLFIKSFQKFECVVFSDYAKGALSFIKNMIDMLNKHNIESYVDPKFADFSLYLGASFIKPNHKEFQNACIFHKINQDPQEAQKFFSSTYDIKNLLITLGKDGACLASKDGILSQNSIAQDIFDVTGAGDAFMAGFVMSKLYGASSKEALDVSSRIAAEVIGKLGTVQPQFPIDLYISISQKGIRSAFDKLIVIDLLKKHGEKIVFTNGCFDILHLGHINYLKSAKKLGDILVVGLNDDESIARLKGNDRPINAVSERAAMLESLPFIDFVISFRDDTPIELIKQLLPDVLVKGGDYENIKDIVGSEIVERNGGNVFILDFYEGFSTSNIIQKVRSNR